MKRNKAPDIYNISAENIIYGGELLQNVVIAIVKAAFRMGIVSEILKLGLLTPVFKNKGSNKCVVNYRGITVTPVIQKIIETVAKVRVKPYIREKQSKLQRGFTENSAPMNCSFFIEECAREYRGLGKTLYVALLDAKSAFDVVTYSSILRKLFLTGIEGSTWKLIYDLHQETQSVIKWNRLISESFSITQRVRQGGTLSADLYKIYINN